MPKFFHSPQNKICLSMGGSLPESKKPSRTQAHHHISVCVSKHSNQSHFLFDCVPLTKLNTCYDMAFRVFLA